MKKIYPCLLLITLLLFTKQLNAQEISQLSFYSPLISTFDMKYTNNHLVDCRKSFLYFVGRTITIYDDVKNGIAFELPMQTDKKFAPASLYISKAKK